MIPDRLMIQVEAGRLSVPYVRTRAVQNAFRAVPHYSRHGIEAMVTEEHLVDEWMHIGDVVDLIHRLGPA